MRAGIRTADRRRVHADRRRVRRVARAGARRRSATRGGAKSRRRAAARAAEGEGGDHVGAVDAPPARHRPPATAPASPRPAGTTTCSSTPARDVIARWFTEAARVLRAADHSTSAADVVEATRLAVVARRAARSPARRAAEVDDVGARGARRRDRHADAADQQRARHRHADRRGPRLDADGAARARPRSREQRRLPAEARGAGRARSSSTCASRIDLRRSRLLHRLTLLGVPWGARDRGPRAAPARSARRGSCGGSPSSRCGSSRRRRSAPPSRRRRRLRSRSERRRRVARRADRPARAVRCSPVSTTRSRGLVALRRRPVGASRTTSLRLMEALPPLARTIRYGDVRGTDASALVAVVRSIVGRVAAGLGAACTGARRATAPRTMAQRLARVAGRARAARATTSTSTALHGGRRASSSSATACTGCCRASPRGCSPTAADARSDAVERRVSRALSPGTRTARRARRSSRASSARPGACSSTTRCCSRVLDQWIATLPADAFADVLPLLRRTFGAFDAAERRSIGERVRTGEAPGTHRGAGRARSRARRRGAARRWRSCSGWQERGSDDRQPAARVPRG